MPPKQTQKLLIVDAWGGVPADEKKGNPYIRRAFEVAGIESDRIEIVRALDADRIEELSERAACIVVESCSARTYPDLEGWRGPDLIASRLQGRPTSCKVLYLSVFEENGRGAWNMARTPRCPCR